jgi:hypothetical protein
VSLADGKVLVAGGFDRFFDFVAASELYDPVDGTWRPSGAMRTLRQVPTATLLTNGKVLAAGGFGNQNVLSSAELYDPAAGAWMLTGAMHDPRWEAAAVRLPNGKVLVAGGAIDISLALNRTAELYDPTTGVWTTTGSMSHERRTFTLTLLPTGKVLAVGGYGTNGPLASADLYDPAAGTWTPTGPLQTARAAHTATLLPNGKVLVAGGAGVNPAESATPVDPTLATAEIYDPATGKWAFVGSLGQPRQAATATLLSSGKVLVAGGMSFFETVFPTSAEIFDPATGKWTPTLPLVSGREDHIAALLAGDRVLLAGGFNSSDTGPSTELFDPASAVAAPFLLTDPIKLRTGEMQFNFRNTPGLAFKVLSAMDLGQSPGAWTSIGVAVERSPGHYQFTDATEASPQRFYRALAP